MPITCPSVETFKKKLNSNLKKVPEYFHIGNRKENIALCQIRNEASNLNLANYNYEHFLHMVVQDQINNFWSMPIYNFIYLNKFMFLTSFI
jgi:hypothetical protein